MNVIYLDRRAGSRLFIVQADVSAVNHLGFAIAVIQILTFDSFSHLLTQFSPTGSCFCVHPNAPKNTSFLLLLLLSSWERLAKKRLPYLKKERQQHGLSRLA